MNLRPLLTPEAVLFEEIVNQRNENKRGDYLTYSLELGDKHLRDINRADKYGIGIPQQREIILGMSDILDIDWITEPADLDENWNETKCVFNEHDTDWMEERYDIPYKYEVDGQHPYEDSLFIEISFETIKKIRDNCISKFSCRLCYDEEDDIIVVKCSNGKTYPVTKLTSGDRPFDVLKYTITEANGFATRDALNKADSDDNIHIGKDSLATTVYDRKSVVRNELSPFVKLTSKTIQVVDANLTQIELDKLENT